MFTLGDLNPLMVLVRLCTLFLNEFRLTHLACLATHFPPQRKDFSLMLFTQVMVCDLQVNQLLRNLWVTG